MMLDTYPTSRILMMKLPSGVKTVDLCASTLRLVVTLSGWTTSQAGWFVVGSNNKWSKKPMIHVQDLMVGLARGAVGEPAAA